ncbi:hypothetical protein VC1_35 [Vibrio phage Vc1]|uniref:Uncharacterized protein n=1 Tax=Vibrio phage Vc1 TaxID=1480731 RepID=A0A9X9TDD3_9CAUD|nr:hypothetical protein KMB90_gp35 [Vibrio virus 2019VC1]
MIYYKYKKRLAKSKPFFVSAFIIIMSLTIIYFQDLIMREFQRFQRNELETLKRHSENWYRNEHRKPRLRDPLCGVHCAPGFKEAYAGNLASRNARFMCWMQDRKDDYVAMRRYNVQKNYCTGGYSILDQDDFTDFIVSV